MSSIMTVLGLSCLTSWFSALLPSDNENDSDAESHEYYHVLGLDRSASQEDIRRAYKVKSLELHPDKVAQKGRINAQEAAALYEHVQQANAVLSHEKKTRLYHAVGCSPAKYKFISTGAWHNPTALHHNLSHASLLAKSRIFFLLAVVLVFILLQPLLIVVKLNQILSSDEDGGALQDTKWTVVLIPWWVAHGLYVALWLFLWMASLQSKDSNRVSILMTLLEQICWLTWEILLAMRWDRTIDSNYAEIFIPFYLVLGLRCLHALYTMRRMRLACTKMVSLEYLNSNVLEEDGKVYDDLSPEERDVLHKDFVLVHHDQDIQFLLQGLVDEDDLEEAKVHASVEFKNAMETYYYSFSKLIQTLFYWTPFCILTVLKLDNHITVSWWVVFLPLLVFLGYNVLSNCFLCCCGAVAGDEVVIGNNGDDDDDEEETDNDDDDENDEQDEENGDKSRNVSSSSGVPFAPADGEIDQPFGESKAAATDKAGTPADLIANAEHVDTTGSEVPSDPNAITEQDEMEPAKTTNADGTSPKEQPNAEADTDTKKEENFFEDVVELYSPTNDSPKPRDIGDVEQQGNEAANDEEEIDPEVFEAWQSAYEEAEASATDEQVKAQGNCCLASLELMILCLLVGKLDQAYEASVDNGDDVGYNAVWIIFPILLLAGILLCCCACVIYGSRPATAENGTNEEEPPVVPIPTDADQQKENTGTTTVSPAKEEPPLEDADEEEARGGYDADEID